jgi:hypothetical protein
VTAIADEICFLVFHFHMQKNSLNIRRRDSNISRRVRIRRILQILEEILNIIRSWNIRRRNLNNWNRSLNVRKRV